MTKSQIHTLMELARNRTDEATRQLGRLQTQSRDQEERLRVLVQYRSYYEERFREQSRTGLDHHGWRNFQDFMGKLDAAIAQQHKVLAFARQHVEAGQAQWRQQHRTLKSYDVLRQRLATGEALTEARREQRQSDEHTSGSHRLNGGRGED